MNNLSSSLIHTVFLTWVVLLSRLTVAAQLGTDPASTSGVVASAISKTVKPCEDFYQFACGNWIQTTKIPDDKPGWSRGFLEVAERNEKILRGILEGEPVGPKGGDIDKAKVFYAECMDEKKAETASLATLLGYLAQADAVSDPKSLAAFLATLHLRGAEGLFSFGPTQDFKDSSQQISEADQGGLSLPDRDYYLSDNAKMKTIRAQFREHVSRSFQLLGDRPKIANVEADTVLRLETALARASLSRVERRDPHKVYHRLERAGLKKLAPIFMWDDYFAAIGIPAVQAVNVAVPGFFSGLNEVLTSVRPGDLKTYLRWHMLERAMPALGKRFVDERFKFSSTAFTGEKKLKPRWKRCIAAGEGSMGELVGKAFVEVKFSPDSKKESQAMIQRVEDAFESSLKATSWMDEPTREKAMKKLKRVFNQTGYPDKWRDYGKLKIERVSHLENLLNADLFNSEYELAKIGKPVDRNEWHMPPHMVNAYYSAVDNKMVFPAGILQTPFFDQAAPLPTNYGGIGMVMGHELTHGFDDEGRKFDDLGNLHEWWSAKVEKEFLEKASCLVKQYANYVAVDDVHVNAELTLGENIADQGGIRIAYAAAEPQFSNVKPKEGYDDRQKFFLGFAQSWCTKLRPEFLRMKATVDPHSPAQFRVNGPLVNFPKFAEAFACKAGDKMVSEKPCSVW